MVHQNITAAVENDPQTDTHHEPPSVRTYFVVYIALMVLMVATIVAAFLPLHELPGHYWVRLIAMTIATIKGALIVMYFMHVKTGPRRVVIFALAGFLWLGILIVFTFADYMSRNTSFPGNPKGEPKFFMGQAVNQPHSPAQSLDKGPAKPNAVHDATGN